MHKIAASLVGAAAVGASLLALRPSREVEASAPTPRAAPVVKGLHAGETVPAEISLDKLRELGL